MDAADGKADVSRNTRFEHERSVVKQVLVRVDIACSPSVEANQGLDACWGVLLGAEDAGPPPTLSLTARVFNLARSGSVSGTEYYD